VITRRAAIVAGGAAAALALAAGVYFGALRHGAGPGAGADAATLLALTLPDAAGKDEPLAQWRGKLLVVNFWATWCAPCREEMPEFVRAQREFGGKGLQFVGIAVDDAAKVRQFTEEIGLNYPALVGGYGAMELSRTLGNQYMALPFTLIVGRDGTIVHTQLGPLSDDKLRQIIGKFI
jgi:thiol-disulfide isomerase/thioredoxin